MLLAHVVVTGAVPSDDEQRPRSTIAGVDVGEVRVDEFAQHLGKVATPPATPGRRRDDTPASIDRFSWVRRLGEFWLPGEVSEGRCRLVDAFVRGRPATEHPFAELDARVEHRRRARGPRSRRRVVTGGQPEGRRDDDSTLHDRGVMESPERPGSLSHP